MISKKLKEDKEKKRMKRNFLPCLLQLSCYTEEMRVQHMAFRSAHHNTETRPLPDTGHAHTACVLIF